MVFLARTYINSDLARNRPRMRIRLLGRNTAGEKAPFGGRKTLACGKLLAENMFLSQEIMPDPHVAVFTVDVITDDMEFECPFS